MDIQTQKEILIEQIREIDDIDLIHVIKSMLDYALKKESDLYDIPEEHQRLVMERFEQVRQNPERLLDWDEAKKTLKA